MPGKARERGQGMIEYALLIALIAIVVIAALSILGQSLSTVFYGIAEALQSQCGNATASTFRSYAGEGSLAPPGTLSLTSPTAGTVTQRYWFCHKGLDVAAGTVRFAGWSNQGYGNMVVIDHGGYQTLYAHFSTTPSVSTGQTVTAGAIIGSMGNTGFSTGPHLHFEIRLGREVVDPGSYFP